VGKRQNAGKAPNGVKDEEAAMLFHNAISAHPAIRPETAL
jgi:hypothetical protein